ncbi:2Fe-2S iron-sulfur cluster binding domain-containing protein [Acidimicrobiaceae bacterium USS-CC1]|uniref:2Fe-2S iron-sulfur cluster binding domain-containing protein n=1 Tax=Acidiferrimicrobium australe TaxID=2664430 RepID=A0ABW9QQ38_9ACTN|nr:2Fe-2S iron-sulfur cluster binding domain-containing protein [Acidiferrimicrobium australe]
MSHKVKLEPVGIEMDVEEGETILSAAFRQGLMLMHGCKEGQCSACKSFLLDGDLDMERYSTFALADYEREEGYVLLCRSHAYSDLEIELINYDEDMLHSGLPVREALAEVRAIDVLTHDIRRLVLGLVEPADLAFRAGQYVDLTIPGTDHVRSFSMANTPASAGVLEFLIKMYPGGRFSSLLAGELSVGDRLRLEGPYGMCTLRPSSERDLVMLGGGAGMAPLLSLLRSLAETRSGRRIRFYYGARSRSDLFYLDELADLGRRLPGLTFVPALSAPAAGDGWEGETGMVTDVLDRHEDDLGSFEAYLCGPPPMIDAAVPVLIGKGIDESRIHFDKFTVSAEAGSATA